MSFKFYTDLPVIPRFEEITNIDEFHRVPDSWSIVISDVVNSREAIRNGHYKSVNTIGAAGIIAVLNAITRSEIPYVFGGDGATLCVPSEFFEKVKLAMLGTQKMAAEAFNLTLRVGAVPLPDIRAHGEDVLIARTKVSDEYAQAVFAGGGLALADSMLKQNLDKYQFTGPEEIPPADFSGLECRWNKVKQPNRKVLSLLIRANTTSQKHGMDIYRDTIGTIKTIVKSGHPIVEAGLSFSWNPDWLKNEFKTRNFFKSIWAKIHYFIDLYYRIFIGIVLMKFNITTNDFNWGDYKPQLVNNSDYQKFDDMLRIVISCAPDEKRALVEYLDALEDQQVLRYGMHESEAALITCMIEKYNRLHFHFIDGDEGGYAMAADHLAAKF